VIGKRTDNEQFGHNDQKAASGVTIADYKTNLARFASEATSAGATPILLTPLTRRSFDKNTHKVIENLVDQRGATIEVAQANSLKWIDLNKASVDYVNSIGQQAASKYNLDSGDWTHLNTWGSVVFARMVSDLLASTYPSDFVVVTKKNETLSALIKAGKPA
jgi:lysophospholipase L1-like esterase